MTKHPLLVLGLYWLILMSITGCDGHQNHKFYPIENSIIKLSLADTIKLSPKDIINFSKLNNLNDTLFWTIYDWNSQRYHVFDLKRDKLLKSIDFSVLSSSATLNNRASVSMISGDSIIVFSDIDQKLILINFKGEILAEVNSNENKKPAYVAVSYFDRDFNYFNNKIFINIAYTDNILNSSEAFKEYFSRPMELVIDLLKPEYSYKYTLMAPSNYRNGNYYGQTEHFRCINNESEVIYSFPANDSLFIYFNSELEDIAYAGSKYESQTSKYNLDKLKNHAYLREYIRTNPFYQKIVYDPFRKFYYRAFKKKCSYLNESGNIRRNSEIPWSLIILDNKFNIIGEMDFNPSEYSMSKIVPTREGLIISYDLEKCINKNQAVFGVIDIDSLILKMKDKK